MDDADRAQEDIEIMQSAALALRTMPDWAYRSHCRDCGERLEAHRRPYGRCIGCARDAERSVRPGIHE